MNVEGVYRLYYSTKGIVLASLKLCMMYIFMCLTKKRISSSFRMYRAAILYISGSYIFILPTAAYSDNEIDPMYMSMERWKRPVVNQMSEEHDP